MKKQRLFLEASSVTAGRFKVVKVVNSLDFKPGEWLTTNDVEQAMAKPGLDVEIKGSK